MMSKYEKGLSVITQIGGHEFSNLTNCNITLSISYPNAVANLLSKLKGPPFG
jgi:hypothetical protein